MLTANELTYMRAEAEQAMPDSVHIQRQSRVADGQGGFTIDWNSVYQNIPARLTSKGGSESTALDREDVRVDFVLTVAYDQSIETSDRVVHSSGTYEVQAVDDGKSWAVATRCQMRRL